MQSHCTKENKKITWGNMKEKRQKFPKLKWPYGWSVYQTETKRTGHKREERDFLNGPSIPLVPCAAVQTRLWMTKTSSSAAGVSLRVCLGQTGTLQQEETGRGVARGLGNKGKKEKKRKVFAGGEERRRRTTCTSEGQKWSRIVHAVT